MQINEIAEQIHATARLKGWWDSPLRIQDMSLEQWYQLINEYRIKVEVCMAEPYIQLRTEKILQILNGFMELILHARKRNVAEMLALIHSEVSEALEGYRKDRQDGDGSLGEELADTVIRIMDMAVGLGINLEQQIMDKHKRNQLRPHRHGNQKA